MEDFQQNDKLPEHLRPEGSMDSVSEYPVRLERMSGEVIRRNDTIPEIAALTEEQLLDFAHFAVDSDSPGGIVADYRPGHNRSFVWSEHMMQDESGETLGKINIKGTGYISLGEWGQGHHIIPESERRTLEPRKLEQYRDGMLGLMSLEDAQTDFDNSEKMAELGIRTSRGVAIIKLETVFYPDMGIVEVATLKEKGIIPEDFEPVVYVRTTGVDHRIRDYEDPNMIPRSNRKWLRERKGNAISGAMEAVSAEYGIENMDLKQYLLWFSKTFGEQVGKLHMHGYVHNGLFKAPRSFVHPVDVTLDCRILDLDNVETVEILRWKLEQVGMEPEKAEGILESGIRGDLEAVRNSLKALLASCRDVSDSIDRGDVSDEALIQEMIETFEASYDEQFLGSKE